NFLTPLGKFVCTELSNKVAYDSLQIHGGVGYIKDFPIERLYRDARITNIYEGTTQLQVVASIGAVTSGFFFELVRNTIDTQVNSLREEKSTIEKLIDEMEKTAKKVKDYESKEFLDFSANYIIEMASIIYRLVLYLPVADQNEEKRDLFYFFLNDSKDKINYLNDKVGSLLENYGGDIVSLKNQFTN
ncbi:MAG: acyl-CoA dehydrogenase family protein, partial [Acidobacteriota bacterium]